MTGKIKEFNHELFKNRLIEISKHEKQCDIANKINISPSTLNKYLSGKMQPPIQVLLNLCSVYECSLDDLLGLNSEIEKESNTDKYSCFSDFVSDFLRIYENEDCEIKRIKSESHSDTYNVSFSNHRINKLLKDISDLESLNNKDLYEVWKKDILESSTKFSKEENYNDMDIILPDLMKKINLKQE